MNHLVVKYKELNNKAIDELRKIGVWYAYDSRLALFWLRNNVPKLYEGTASVLPILDELVRMRVDGLEPTSVGGQYV